MKVICAVLALTALFCAAAAAETGGDHKDIVTMTIGGSEHQLWLEDNATARTFAAMLPLSTKMSELNGESCFKFNLYRTFAIGLTSQFAIEGPLHRQRQKGSGEVII